jgi:hypothetical protein
MLQSSLSETRSAVETANELQREIEQLRHSVDSVSQSTRLNPLLFTSIDNLQHLVHKFEEKSFLLANNLNKLNEQKSLYESFVKQEQQAIKSDEQINACVSTIRAELDSIEETHKQTSLE